MIIRIQHGFWFQHDFPSKTTKAKTNSRGIWIESPTNFGWTCWSIWLRYTWIKGNFRILKWSKMEVPTIYKAIFCGDIPVHRPYIGLIYGRYLQFRILKFPLNCSDILSIGIPSTLHHPRALPRFDRGRPDPNRQRSARPYRPFCWSQGSSTERWDTMGYNEMEWLPSGYLT